MNKVWLVTGSASGLGRNIAEAVLESGDRLVATARDTKRLDDLVDRKSTRLNSSHSQISYAVFCLKNKFRTVGEDYSTLDSIRRTGGLRPDSTWVENRENVQANAAIAHPLGVKVLTFHPGLLPHY